MQNQSPPIFQWGFFYAHCKCGFFKFQKTSTGAANGIWADCAVTITDGANVTATGLNGCGIFSDTFFETVGITNGATAILSGSTYGIGGNSYVEIDNATATVTGDTAAIESFRDISGIYKWRTSESGAFTMSAETKFRANRSIARVEFVPVPTYAVIFDANGGTGTMITAEVNEVHTAQMRLHRSFQQGL